MVQCYGYTGYILIEKNKCLYSFKIKQNRKKVLFLTLIKLIDNKPKKNRLTFYY